MLSNVSRAHRDFCEHARHPTITGAAAELLCAAELRLLEDQVITKLPRRSGRVHWHQDASYWPIKPRDSVSCWLALDATTAASGAMQYVPGSHLVGDGFASVYLATGEPRSHEAGPAVPHDPLQAGYEIEVVELAAGDCVFHHFCTWHASGPNRTTNLRRGVITRYTRSGARVDGSRRALYPIQELENLADDAEIGGEAFPVVWP